MNYWLPDPANLGECMEPLIRLVEEVSVDRRGDGRGALRRARLGAAPQHRPLARGRARSTARSGACGRPAAPGSASSSGTTPSSCGRPERLVRRLYPLIAGAARFIFDVLVPLPGHGLAGDQSIALARKRSSRSALPLCAGPAMDRQIVRDLIDALLAASAELGIDDDTRRRGAPAAAAHSAGPHRSCRPAPGVARRLGHGRAGDRPPARLAPLRPLSRAGRSTSTGRPALAAAARRSLEIRGDNATGWGIGWRLNLWARLRDGDHAHDVLRLLLSPERTYPNLFDAHPPFQIDGNFGGAAGILEMLVQSGEGWVHLLPALPSAWPKGSVRGVCARGGLEVDLTWAAGRLTAAEITSSVAGTVRVLYRGQTARARLGPGETWRFPVEDAIGTC